MQIFNRWTLPDSYLDRPKEMAALFSGVLLASIVWNLYRHSAEFFLLRVWEVLPGPFTHILERRSFHEERRAITLLASPDNIWNEDERCCIQSFLQMLIENPSSLRKLDYLKEPAFFSLKGCFKSYSVEDLQKKLDRKRELTPWDCGALTNAEKWVSFLEKLQAKQITGLDSYLDQWRQVADINRGLAEEKGKLHALLLSEPVRIFLLGKKESLEQRASDLGSFDIPNLIKHIFNGNLAHLGFVLAKGDQLHLSHLAQTHEITDANSCIEAPCSYLFLNVSIKPLLPDKADKDRLQTLFATKVQEKALVHNKSLRKRTIVATTIGYPTGAKTLRPESKKLGKVEYCTAYVAKILLEAWGEVYKECPQIRPIFSRYDAIGRMTVPQLVMALKRTGVISLLEDEGIDQIWDRKRMIADYRHL